jgi:uncharacterized protein (DUF1499 family)
MNNIKTISIIFFTTAMFLTLLSCSSKTPEIQMVDGKLRPCPKSPNCVSSESDDTSSRIEPFTFQGSPEKAWKVLKDSTVNAGGNIQEENAGYLRAIFTSKLFRFVDDVECRMVSAEGIIHIRSGSRTGYSDFGVNKKRVEELRTLFDKMKNK